MKTPGRRVRPNNRRQKVLRFRPLSLIASDWSGGNPERRRFALLSMIECYKRYRTLAKQIDQVIRFDRRRLGFGAVAANGATSFS